MHEGRKQTNTWSAYAGSRLELSDETNGLDAELAYDRRGRCIAAVTISTSIARCAAYNDQLARNATSR
jgi:hypothetical protein